MCKYTNSTRLTPRLVTAAESHENNILALIMRHSKRKGGKDQQLLANFILIMCKYVDSHTPYPSLAVEEAVESQKQYPGFDHASFKRKRRQRSSIIG